MAAALVRLKIEDMSLNHTGVPLDFDFPALLALQGGLIAVLRKKQPHFITGTAVGTGTQDRKLNHPAGVVLKTLHGKNVVSFQLTGGHMAQTVKLLQEKDLTDEDALNQRITELETKYHDTLAVVKDLEGRMKANKELRYHVAAYTSTKGIVQQFNTAKRPAAFEEQHRAELTAYRAAAAYFKANDITKLPSPKKLEAEYAQLASEKAKFYEQYKEAKEELLKLKTAKQNVASFFREKEPAQQER